MLFIHKILLCVSWSHFIIVDLRLLDFVMAYRNQKSSHTHMRAQKSRGKIEKRFFTIFFFSDVKGRVISFPKNFKLIYFSL